jgi:hypothetical protein
MESSQANSDADAPRRRYAAPELKEFGRIAELTLALDNMGAMDGGTAMGLMRT